MTLLLSPLTQFYISRSVSNSQNANPLHTPYTSLITFNDLRFPYSPSILANASLSVSGANPPTNNFYN